MTESSHCQVCGGEVPAGAPEEMCPRCLLALAGPALREEPTQVSMKLSSVSETEPQTFTVGTRVGDYELLREIGRGGMGVVYEARHSGLKRKVALKVLPWAEFASEEQRERFRREAEAVARLNHAHIVSVYEWGNHGGCPFMAMQLVAHARTLAEEIAKEPMTPREAARILAKVARGVHYSHQHGVLHRDIKPGNILLDANREPLLVDFGVARLEDAAFRLTHTDLVCGTPSYMPPEQATGSNFTTVSDVYSLGAVLYEALTGVPPFRGKTVADVMRQLAEEEPASPRSLRPELDRDLSTVVLKCLEKNPVRRYGSAEALAEDLERWLENWPILARPGTVTTRVLKWARRRPGVAGLAVALVLTSIIGVGSLIYGWRKAVSEEQQREEMLRQKTEMLRQAQIERDQKTEMLRQSLVSDARSTRLSNQPGRQFYAIESLQRAAAIRPSIELQNEAVAALALSDLRPAETWEGNPDKQPLVALSRDFRLVASTRKDGSVVVIERPSMREVANLPGQGKPVNWILRFSEDARWLAVGYCGPDEQQVNVIVWDLQKCEAALRLEHVSRAALDFWPDGSRVVACVGTELRFYRLSGGTEDRRATSFPDGAYSVRVSATGRFIAASFGASTNSEGRVALLDTQATADGPQWLEDNKGGAQLLSWHPRLDWLAAPCGDGAIRIWDATTRSLLHIITGHYDEVLGAVWNPNGDLMASRSKDGTLKLWDASTGELYVTLEQWTGPLVFSKDGTRLGPGLDKATVRLFEVAPLMGCRRLRNPPDGTVWSASWSHDGGLLATASENVRFWNGAGYELARLKFANPRSVLCAKDSLIVSGGDGVVRWPLAMEDSGGKKRAVLGKPVTLIQEHAWEFAAVSLDESLLAVASAQEVALFDLKAAPGTPPRLFLRGHEGATHVAVSPDGRLVATGTTKGDEVWVWNSVTGDVVRRLPVRGGACVGFTLRIPSVTAGSVPIAHQKPLPMKGSTESLLITGGTEEFRCWNTETWAPGAFQSRRDNLPGHMAISPRRLAVAIDYSRNRVRLVSPNGLETLVDPDCGLHVPLCFNHTGTLFVTANNQGHMFIWDVAWIRHELDRLNMKWRLPEMPFDVRPHVDEVVLPPP